MIEEGDDNQNHHNDSQAHKLEHDHPRKRIIVCCDGTWKDSDGDVQVPTNVTRLSRCLCQDGVDAQSGRTIPQIVYYQAGVGTEWSLYSKFIGGATGKGLSEHIREAYSFICNNYHPGDEIFLVGFSRGAFTARSISSLIRCVGLLTSAGLTYFYQIFLDWEFQLKQNWRSPYPDKPWPNRSKINTPAYRRKLLELELTRPDIPIKAVAVWDTVGSLGIPIIGPFPQAPSSRDFSFVDTKVEANIEYAFQALALDEHRRSFVPTVWEKDPANEWPRVLKQCWFPGCHTDIGGGYADHDLADVTLAWMISQLDPLLAFDHAYIVRENRLSREQHMSSNGGDQQFRDWGLGKIHNSMTPFFRLGGKKIRTPMEYQEMRPKTHTSTGKRLLHTNETVHSSVRVRMGRKGLGADDGGRYDSEALAGWTMFGVENEGGGKGLNEHEEDDEHGEENIQKTKNQINNHDHNNNSNKTLRGMTCVTWRKPDPSSSSSKSTSTSTSTTTRRSSSATLEMPEDVLGDFERQIMRGWWPDAERDFDHIRPGRHATVLATAATAAAAGRSSTFPHTTREEMMEGKGNGGRVGSVDVDDGGGGGGGMNGRHLPERVGTV